MRSLIPGYRILRELSAGGQGIVYEAIQTSTQRKVAIKMMREGAFAGRGDRARFDREVKVLARLNHPSIVAVHDSGTAAGRHYLVMDYVAGHPLDTYMLRGDAPRSVQGILQLFSKICDAVNAAHLAGIIHRDLKPSNIRIDGEGRPHILDFGMAKVPLSDSEASLMTKTGQFVGSLPWASPEQAEGQPDKIDMRTDVYSLGVMLYQMLTGRFPYDVTGNMRDVLDRIMRADPKAPSAVSRQINNEVETVVLKCLNKERERRYQSAGELARDLKRYLDGEPIEAKRDSFGYVVRKQLMRKKVPVAVGLGFVVVILVGLVTSLTLWRRAVTERETAEFRLTAARAEVSRSFAEYQSVIPRLRRAEDLASLLPWEVHARYPRGAPEVTHLDATRWITELLPRSGEEILNGGFEPLDEETVKALKSTAEEPFRPRHPVASAWVRENRDRVQRLIAATGRYRYKLGQISGGELLVSMLLPALQDARFAVDVLAVSALVYHDEGRYEDAADALAAAMRISRYVGDGATMISTLVEIKCRDIINSAFRSMVVDHVATGALPPAYRSFIREVPPFPSFEHAYIGEGRVMRQFLNEAFVGKTGQASARLDLTRLRDLASELEFPENPYVDPSRAMRTDAEALEYEQAVSIITELIEALRSMESATFREISAEGARMKKELIESHPALDPMLPNFTRAIELRREAQMNRDAMVIAVALRILRDSTGRWSESIDDALSRFELKPIARSYYDRDFVYRTVNGVPLLYAVGPNGFDDGGRGLRYEVWSRDSVDDAGDDVLFLTPAGWVP